jgi:hypothetical protein
MSQTQIAFALLTASMVAKNNLVLSQYALALARPF